MSMDWMDAEISKAKSRAKYDKNNTWMITVKLNYRTDGDIIRFLRNTANRQGTIKKALRLLLAQDEKNMR